MTNDFMINCWTFISLSLLVSLCLNICLYLNMSVQLTNCVIASAFTQSILLLIILTHKYSTYHLYVIWMRNMSHLQIEIPTSINRGVWERIVLHTGITGCSLFSQSAFPNISTPLPMKSPQPLVPVVTLGYLKSLQTNSWQIRWNSTSMKIWTWNPVFHEKSMNNKWGSEA